MHGGPLTSFMRIMSAKLNCIRLNKAKHRKCLERSTIVTPRLLHFRDGSCIGRLKKTISVSRYWCFNLQYAHDIPCLYRTRIRARNEEESLGKAFSPERYDRSLVRYQTVRSNAIRMALQSFSYLKYINSIISKASL